MGENFIIRKASGEEEEFSASKLRKYLQRIRIPDSSIDSVIRAVEEQLKNGMSTKEIADMVSGLLSTLEKGELYCARYNIKPAIRKFGPEGHVFEVYISRIFEADGFTTKTGTQVKGHCVEHEVDVVASRGNEHHYVECKFHNREGIRSDVTVAMYTFARFNDIQKAEDPANRYFGWLATNTKLTTEAFKYVNCVGMNLLSVENPANGSIMDKVLKDNLFPVGTLGELETYLPEIFAENIIVIQDVIATSIDKAADLGVPAEVWMQAQDKARNILSQAA